MNSPSFDIMSIVDVASARLNTSKHIWDHLATTNSALFSLNEEQRIQSYSLDESLGVSGHRQVRPITETDEPNELLCGVTLPRLTRKRKVEDNDAYEGFTLPAYKRRKCLSFDDFDNGVSIADLYFSGAVDNLPSLCTTDGETDEVPDATNIAIGSEFEEESSEYDPPEKKLVQETEKQVEEVQPVATSSSMIHPQTTRLPFPADMAQLCDYLTRRPGLSLFNLFPLIDEGDEVYQCLGSRVRDGAGWKVTPVCGKRITGKEMVQRHVKEDHLGKPFRRKMENVKKWLSSEFNIKVQGILVPDRTRFLLDPPEISAATTVAPVGTFDEKRIEEDAREEGQEREDWEEKKQ